MDAQIFAQIRKAHARSGLSARQYCLRRHVPYHTFLYWVKKTARATSGPAPKAGVSFVELVPGAAADARGEVTCLIGPAKLIFPAPRTAQDWRTLLLSAKEAFAC